MRLSGRDRLQNVPLVHNQSFNQEIPDPIGTLTCSMFLVSGQMGACVENPQQHVDIQTPQRKVKGQTQELVVLRPLCHRAAHTERENENTSYALCIWLRM